MSVDPTVSSSVSSTSATVQSTSTQTADNSKKANSDSSFKDEMSKVSEAKKDDNKEEKTDKVTSDKTVSEKDKAQDDNVTNPKDKDALQGQVSVNKEVEGIDYSNFGSVALNNANRMLANDIQRMVNNTVNISQIDSNRATKSVQSVRGNIFSFGNLGDSKISMTESDAEFFINLTQNDNVSAQKVVAQAQSMLNSGADVSEVKQNVKISEALLNAINTAKETNQPLRIDFDKNMSVILRINKEGAIAANFIPGDKAVEQYLRNNIENLKATFREEDLPYTDLSYSHSSKDQNEKRRNRQQGDK